MKKRKNYVGVVIDEADIKNIDQARRFTGMNRSAFIRFAAIKRALSVLKNNTATTRKV